jgi:hypothetical protein
MHDKSLIIESLEQVVENLPESTSKIHDFGEEVKRIDRYTENQFLSRYPSIPWQKCYGIAREDRSRLF